MKALIVVDVQNDFCPGGALAVEEGDQVVPVINKAMDHVDMVVACQDWHPADHGSFAANHDGKMPGERVDLAGLEQILWPVHCVQGTPGAAFHRDLRAERFEAIVRKGMDREIDSYGAFFDNGRRRATGLEGLLKGRAVETVLVAGLALDYCVKFTALDAVKLGFRTLVVADGCRAVQAGAEDMEATLAELRDAGVQTIQSTDLT